MNRLQTRMLLWIWGSVALLFVVVMTTSFVDTRDHAIKELTLAASLQAGLHAARVAEAFHTAASAADAAVGSVVRNAGDPGRLRELMDLLLAVRPEVVSVRLSLAATPSRPAQTLVRTREGQTIRSLRDELSDDPFWTRPEEQEGRLVSSYTRPVVDGQGRLIASLSVQVSLEEAVREIGLLAREGAAYGFLFDREGRIVAFPDSDQRPLDDTLSPELQSALLKRAEPSFIATADPLFGRPSWIALEPVRGTGLGLGSVYLVENEMLELYRLQLRGLLLAAVGLVLLFVVVALLSGSIARPISQLAEATLSVTESGFDLRLDPPEGSTREVVAMTEAFNRVLDGLRSRAEALREATRERQQMESELDIAARIQSSFLPSSVPTGERFRLHATSRPAREVGGDFYDFFKVDDRRLGFCLGDVSGRGIPAALYMAACRTLLHSVAGTGAAPDATLARLNQELLEHLESGMFVTLFYGLLDLETGELVYANGGHHLPLVSDQGGVRELAPVEGLPLGILPEAEFRIGQDVLRPGDGLFLFSDGVTEAMDADGELFESERLLQVLERVRGQGARERMDAVLAAVQEFTAGATASDDLSILALDYQGAGAAEE